MSEASSNTGLKAAKPFASDSRLATLESMPLEESRKALLFHLASPDQRKNPDSNEPTVSDSIAHNFITLYQPTVSVRQSTRR